MLGERSRATESEKKVEVGWEREKDTKRDRVGERVKDRETGSGVGERESEPHIKKKIERVTW